MDQAGQPHAVEMAAHWHSVSSPPSWPGLSSLLHANRLQGQVAHLTEQLLAADQAKQTAQAEATAQPAQLAASESHDEALQARIDELEELLHAPWHQALLAYARKHGLLLKCWVVVAAVMGAVFGLMGWLTDKETVLFAVAVLSIVQSINNTAMLAEQLLS
ncbi:hypothetical protein D9Q98_002986 [Chlorella vulgaris]|uniref:Uncharacterized protein n=1 Tax=Chlorella vulgaris TaxID=3077 RepID=A0A9D4YZC8_CHLVU|nr:hypothetical protein D9Q98_002986 [Chlorella vulgaris]